MPPTPRKTYDLAIIGAGINGAGIARDAAGRGLSVLLAQQHAEAAAGEVACDAGAVDAAAHHQHVDCGWAR